MKTYTAASGYVYQYYFVGKRDALADAPEAPATEYVFDVSPDRKATYAVSVFLKPEALDAWRSSKARALTDTEQYAAAKMRLLRGFDEAEVIRSHVSMVVDAENVGELLAEIGVE
ncbi:MAG TPA: hypothetical protein VFA60_13850 [Terriglobales bacterium]|nr:hypothetical protein [Terriglobales bacterium]